MRFTKFLLTVLTCAFLTGGWLCAEEAVDPADKELKALLGLQQELLARAAEAKSQEEVETLRPRLQSLVFDYERYLRTYPKKIEGYVSYSMLLGNPLLDERNRAKALLLKANSLDANQPIVKNQLGKYLAEEGHPLEAVNYFLAAIQLAPDEPLYHFQLGQLLGAARDDFLRSGEWTPEQIDAAMLHAFAEVVRLAPDNLLYAYRAAEAYYDLHAPRWDDALAAWRALETRVASPAEKQMMRLHEANVLLYQKQLEAAAALLADAVEPALEGQRTKLTTRLDRLRAAPDAEDADEAAYAAATAKAVAAGAQRLTERLQVPNFQIGALPATGALSSAKMIEAGDATPAESSLLPAELRMPTPAPAVPPAPDSAAAATATPAP